MGHVEPPGTARLRQRFGCCCTGSQRGHRVLPWARRHGVHVCGRGPPLRATRPPLLDTRHPPASGAHKGQGRGTGVQEGAGPLWRGAPRGPAPCAHLAPSGLEEEAAAAKEREREIAAARGSGAGWREGKTPRAGGWSGNRCRVELLLSRCLPLPRDLQ